MIVKNYRIHPTLHNYKKGTSLSCCSFGLYKSMTSDFLKNVETIITKGLVVNSLRYWTSVLRRVCLTDTGEPEKELCNEPQRVQFFKSLHTNSKDISKGWVLAGLPSISISDTAFLCIHHFIYFSVQLICLNHVPPKILF